MIGVKRTFLSGLPSRPPPRALRLQGWPDEDKGAEPCAGAAVALDQTGVRPVRQAQDDIPPTVPDRDTGIGLRTTIALDRASRSGSVQ